MKIDTIFYFTFFLGEVFEEGEIKIALVGIDFQT
jgi:hypothetical protein